MHLQMDVVVSVSKQQWKQKRDKDNEKETNHK